jgi:hypothetical protein
MDLIRLNLSDITDIPKAIINQANEHGYVIEDIKLTNLRFMDISGRNGVPIKYETGFMHNENHNKYHKGWRGHIEIINTNIEKSDKLFYSHPFNTSGIIRGFHTGTGSGAQYKNNLFNYQYTFWFFLDDFPILYKMHCKYLPWHEKDIINMKNIYNQNISAYEYSNNHPNVLKISNEINELLRKKSQMINDYCDEYKDDNLIKKIAIDDKYYKMKHNFNNL